MHKIISLLFILSILFSCKETPKEKLTKEFSEWQNKEISLPNEMIFTKWAKDTVKYNYQQKDYKVLIYVDSLGCTSCKLKLESWQPLMKELALISKENIGYIFYFADKKPEEIETILLSENFDFPVVIDEENQLNKLNKFPQQEMFHCFLLDNENKVKIIGNPIYNTKIKDLYLSTINPVNN